MSHSKYNPEEVTEQVHKMWTECVKSKDFTTVAWTLIHTNPTTNDIKATYEQSKTVVIDKSKIANTLSTMEALAIAFREDSPFIITLAFGTKLHTDKKSAVQAMVEQMALYCVSLQENDMLKSIQSLSSFSERLEFVTKFMKKLEQIKNDSTT